MIVYLAAFALTILFVRRAVYYYRKGKGEVSEAASFFPKFAKTAVYSAAQLRDFRLKYFLWYFLAACPLFFVAAVRYDVGTDYFFTYVPNFLKILEGGFPYSEWGFNSLNRLIQVFTDDPQWLFVVTGFIFSFVIVNTVIKYSSNATFSVAVLFLSCFYFFSLNNVRQAISAVLVFSAVPHFVKADFIKFIIHIILAYLFHISAIIMIAPFILVQIKLIRKHFLLFVIFFTLFLPIACKLFELILTNTKYKYYFESYLNDGEVNWLNIIYNLFFFLLAYYILGNRILKDKFVFLLLFMQFMAFWISSVSMFIRISEMISRLTVYFSVFQLLLMPLCFESQTDSVGRTAFLTIYLLAYGAYFVYFILLKGYHQVLPYQWIFGAG